MGSWYHMDIMIPGGGGSEWGYHCAMQYDGFKDIDVRDWLGEDCNKLPEELRIGCWVWWKGVHRFDNPIVDF